MISEKKNSSKPLLNVYMQASVIGATRGLIGLPLEHPFDYVKTKIQAAPKGASAVQIVKDTYRISGIKGFYAGAIPNGVRMISKEFYRCPLLTFFSTFYKQYVFDGKDEYRLIQKGMIGFSLASIDVFAITPLERFKVWMMTKEDKNKTLKYLFLKSDNPMKTAFQSWNIIYPRLIISWVAFLMADEAFKSMARRYHANHELPYSTLAGIGVAVGLVSLAIGLPFDMIETLVQKDNPWPNQGAYKTMKAVHTTFGFSALYAGWRVHLAKQMIQSILNVNLIDALERNLDRSTLAMAPSYRMSN